MSNFAKCDFCTKEIKWMTPFYTFDMSYRGHTDKITIDVCKSCYKKFVKSVKTGVLEVNADDEVEWEWMKFLFTYVYDEEWGSGFGSVILTTKSNKITAKLITDAVEWTKNDYAEKGIKLNSLIPMGWYKFDDEDESKSEWMQDRN